MVTQIIRPSTLDGIKRLSKKLKRSHKIPYYAALDEAAKAANYHNYKHARKILGSFQNSDFYITVYWLDKTRSYEEGRETLPIKLSHKLEHLVNKSDLKFLRGVGNFARLVAPDHLVFDYVAKSQENARNQACSLPDLSNLLT